MLDQRAQGIHHGNAIAAGSLDIVVAYNNVLVTVSAEAILLQLGALELCVGVGIAHGNAPAADVGKVTALDQNVRKACRTGGGFVLGLQSGHINAAVVHMLVVNVAVYIVDAQVFQRDAAAHALVLGDNCHAGALHFVRLGVAFPQHGRGTVGDLQIAQGDIGGIVQQHGGGNIAVINMGGGVQLAPVILIPNTLPVGSDQRGAAFTISTDGDGAALRTAAAKMQKLFFKAAAAHQQHGVAGGKRQAVYRKQRSKGTILVQTVIGVIADPRIHVICLAQGCRTPPPAYVFR